MWPFSWSYSNFELFFSGFSLSHTVHVNDLPASVQSRFTVVALLFVAVSDDMFSFSDVEVLILT